MRSVEKDLQTDLKLSQQTKKLRRFFCYKRI